MDDDIPFCGPNEFADMLYKAITKVGFFELMEGAISISKREQWLRQLCKCCYVASFSTEELRGISCRLILCPSATPKISFTGPIAVTAGTIRSLSPIAGDADSALLLTEELEPTLSGVASFRKIMNEYTTFEFGFPLDFSLKPFLSLRIAGPGHVKAYCCYNSQMAIAMTLKGGVVTTPQQGSSQIDAWARNSAFAEKYTADFKETPLRYLDFISTSHRVLQHIILKACSFRHGGMITLVPCSSEAWKRVMTPRYFGNIDLGKAIYNHVLSISTSERLQDQQSGFTSPIKTHYIDEKLVTGAVLMEACDSIASLTQVDGAVLLNDQLQLIGFGTSIEASVRMEQWEAISKKNGIPVERLQRYGHRRHAAIAAALNVNDCLSIVVSQDGDVRLIGSSYGECVDIEDSYEPSSIIREAI